MKKIPRGQCRESILQYVCMYGEILNITCDVKLYIEQAKNNLVTSCADIEISGASEKDRLVSPESVRVYKCILCAR